MKQFKTITATTKRRRSRKTNDTLAIRIKVYLDDVNYKCVVSRWSYFCMK